MTQHWDWSGSPRKARPRCSRCFGRPASAVLTINQTLYRRPLYLQGTYQAVASWLPELFAARGLAASDDPAALAKLRVPVILIWGETDTITPLSQGQTIERLIPGSVLLQIPRAGHIPQIEEPTAFRDALAQALRSR